MRATTWEFRNRAIIFGFLMSAAFAFYLLDSQNTTSWLGNELEHRFGLNAYRIAIAAFAAAALLIVFTALLRSWASAYLHAGIVYASEIKTANLVPDGPYRFVRNPLYLANVFMTVGMGALMSRAGLIFGVLAMLAFCYRLILGEAELQDSRATQFAAYLRAVPRLWPAFSPRVPASGQLPRWRAGFKAELWYWSLTLLPIVFAISLHK